MSQAIPIATPTLQAPARAKKRTFAGHAAIISALTLLSRVLAVVREAVVAKYFGAGVVSAAFTVAFKIPNLFRKLLGEGALSAAFIPLYAQAVKTSDRTESDRFAAASVNLLARILIVLALLGEALLWAMPHLIPLRPENMLIVRFSQIMLPYLVLVCGTAFLSAILQVHHRFALPALAPVVLNVVHIAVIVLGARWMWLTHAHGAAEIALQTRLAYWLSFGVLLAGILQITMLMPSLRAVGFRMHWNESCWTPQIKRMLKLSIPVALAAGVLQLSVIVDTVVTVVLTKSPGSDHPLHWFGRALARPLEVGAVVRLNWAQLLYQFPLGVFAIALATAIFPGLSADVLDTDRAKFQRVLRQGILLSLWEGLPASLGLILVREPAVRLVFHRGNFTAADTHWVAAALMFYAAGIWAFSLQQIMNRAYYALHDMTTPLLLSIVTMAINTIVEVPLCFTHLGEAGIAAGTAVSFSAQAIVMLFLLNRRAGGLGLSQILTSAAKMMLACIVMWTACKAVQHLPIFPKGTGMIASMIQLAILISVGAGVYMLICRILGVRAKQLAASA